MGRLDEVDLSQRLGRKQEKAALDDAWKRLALLRLSLGGQLGDPIGPGVCILFEGWDAGGKGGCIRRLVQPIDPRHVRVKQFSAPTFDEKRHHFLWRFWKYIPGHGGMAIFDRSWYGRVLVERIEGFASLEQWRRAYREINEFESTLMAEGVILVKLWLHISHDEQLRRFERRAQDPLKSWKLTDEDWRNRERRGEYEDAVEDMLELTNSPARWNVIPADSKRYARVDVVETVINAMESGMRRWEHPIPEHYLELKAARQDLVVAD